MCYSPINQCGTRQQTNVVLANKPMWYSPTNKCGTRQKTNVVLANKPMWYSPRNQCGTRQQNQCGTSQQTNVVLANKPMWFSSTNQCGTRQQTNVVLANKQRNSPHCDRGWRFIIMFKEMSTARCGLQRQFYWIPHSETFFLKDSIIVSPSTPDSYNRNFIF
jgi:hypothetical protein